MHKIDYASGELSIHYEMLSAKIWISYGQKGDPLYPKHIKFNLVNMVKANVVGEIKIRHFHGLFSTHFSIG